MALPEDQEQRVEVAVAGFMEKRRPPERLRDKVDLGWRVRRQSIELFEIRSAWNDPATRLEIEFAKATYVKSSGRWKIYGFRSKGKWHRYNPHPEVRSIERLFEIVDADEHACFFG